jgi:phage shock protein C
MPPGSKGRILGLMESIHQTFRDQGLVRPRQGRVLAGVIAGLGQRFGIDPWPARLLFTLILMVIPGSQILIYPILWILMPSQVASVNPAGLPPEPNAPLAPSA